MLSKTAGGGDVVCRDDQMTFICSGPVFDHRPSQSSATTIDVSEWFIHHKDGWLRSESPRKLQPRPLALRQDSRIRLSTFAEIETWEPIGRITANGRNLFFGPKLRPQTVAVAGPEQRNTLCAINIRFEIRRNLPLGRTNEFAQQVEKARLPCSAGTENGSNSLLDGDRNVEQSFVDRNAGQFPQRTMRWLAGISFECRRRCYQRRRQLKEMMSTSAGIANATTDRNKSIAASV